MGSQKGQTGNSAQETGSEKGSGKTPLTNATYNMIAGLHNIVDALWRYDGYIKDDPDDDAKEMWQRFRDDDMRHAEELKNHLSRRLQHETGPEGKVGNGPEESGGKS